MVLNYKQSQSKKRVDMQYLDLIETAGLTYYSVEEYCSDFDYQSWDNRGNFKDLQSGTQGLQLFLDHYIQFNHGGAASIYSDPANYRIQETDSGAEVQFLNKERISRSSFSTLASLSSSPDGWGSCGIRLQKKTIMFKGS